MEIQLLIVLDDPTLLLKRADRQIDRWASVYVYPESRTPRAFLFLFL